MNSRIRDRLVSGDSLPNTGSQVTLTCTPSYGPGSVADHSATLTVTPVPDPKVDFVDLRGWSRRYQHHYVTLEARPTGFSRTSDLQHRSRMDGLPPEYGPFGATGRADDEREGLVLRAPLDGRGLA